MKKGFFDKEDKESPCKLKKFDVEEVELLRDDNQSQPEKELA